MLSEYRVSASHRTRCVLAGLVPLDVVQEAMGHMGPWHVVIAVAISLVKFPVAWHQLSIVFLAPPTIFTCIEPSSDTNESMRSMKCEVDVGNGTMEKCTGFSYDHSVFRESIITQVGLLCFIRRAMLPLFDVHMHCLFHLITIKSFKPDLQRAFCFSFFAFNIFLA